MAMLFDSLRAASLGRRPVLKTAAAAMLALAACCMVPRAAAAAESASALVQNLGGEVLAILKSGAPEDQRRDKFRELFAKRFAVADMAQFALGHHWRNINDQQRKQYVDTFRDYVAGLYANRFAGYSGEQFKVVDERPDASDSRQVSAEIVQPKGKNVAVGFRVAQADGELRIVDVKVEGVSLLVTKRSEFGSMIQRRGFDAFLDELKRIASTG